MSLTVRTVGTGGQKQRGPLSLAKINHGNPELPRVFPAPDLNSTLPLGKITMKSPQNIITVHILKTQGKKVVVRREHSELEVQGQKQVEQPMHVLNSSFGGDTFSPIITVTAIRFH